MKTTIKDLLLGKTIVVPAYQRAYSWETDLAKSEDSQAQVNVFMRDLVQATEQPFPYHLGQFLFEPTVGDVTKVIDGQQRLTTVVLFVATALRRLKQAGMLLEDEQALWERFQRDDCFQVPSFTGATFSNCLRGVLDISVETCAEQRLIDAARYFDAYALKDLATEEVRRLLGVLLSAIVVVITLEQASDAIQFFLFQNNRGKDLTQLEIAKVLLMQMALKADKTFCVEKLQRTFEVIYKDVARMEDFLGEDGVLECAWRIYKGSLHAGFSTGDLEKAWRAKQSLQFVLDFVDLLRDNARWLADFCDNALKRKEGIEAESLAIMGPYAWAYPIIVKCYQLGVSAADRQRVWRVLESLTVRKWLIGRRAEMEPRINGVYQNMTKETAAKDWEAVLAKIREPGAGEWWWNYWSDADFESLLCGEITNGGIIKHLLWRYECARLTQVAGGYRFSLDSVDRPEVEHIAPQTKNEEPTAGYGTYEIKNDTEEKGIVSGHYMWRLGNMLVLSKSHNCALGNKPFEEKLTSYKAAHVAQDVEKIAEEHRVAGGPLVWDSACIKDRTDRIVKTLKNIYCPKA